MASETHPSAAYALVAYQTAWLKAHFPAGFMAAVLSSDMDNTDKVVTLIEECRQMKLALLPPDINISNFRFTVDHREQIVYGLGAIKGVGESAIQEIIQQRLQHGSFKSLYDSAKRVDLRKVNRRVLEALCRAGAFDSLNDNRAAHVAELPTNPKAAEQHSLMALTGQNDLFGLVEESVATAETTEGYTEPVAPWPLKETLQNEKLTLGLYLSGHPIDEYEQELKKFTNGSLSELKDKVASSRGKLEARVAGLVIDIRTRQTKQGKTMGFAILDDRTGRIEIAAYRDTYENYRDIFARDNLLVAQGALSVDDFSGNLRLVVDNLYDINQARENFANGLQLSWEYSEQASNPDFVNGLKDTLQPYQGGKCPVTISYVLSQASAEVRLGEGWRIRPTDELLSRLRCLPGVKGIEVKYR